MGPYAHNNYDWVAWDDIDTAITKVKYAMGRNLGGIMVWELGLDDFNGFCNMGKRYDSLSNFLYVLIMIKNCL